MFFVTKTAHAALTKIKLSYLFNFKLDLTFFFLYSNLTSITQKVSIVLRSLRYRMLINRRCYINPSFLSVVTAKKERKGNSSIINLDNF